jgi:dienelactone hydrolase
VHLVALLFAVTLRAGDPLLWGGLEPGPEPVGFHSTVAFDSTRQYDSQPGRPILLQVWYPSLQTAAPAIPYGRYLRVPDVAGHSMFRSRLETLVRDIVSDDLFHKKTEAGLNEQERAAFDRLIGTASSARLDATPARGQFPVVVYHAGARGSFEENFLLFEYLASHGYVVVSSAFQSVYPEVVANNLGGIERSGPDLDFISREIRKWSYADGNRLAAIGHSFGAQLILQWIGGASCPARAFVSLDSTLEYTRENFKGHKPVREALKKLTKPRIPVLLFARNQPDAKPRFSTFDDYLSNCVRYEAAASGVRHDDFLTHGFLGRALMKKAEADVVRRSYEEICRTIRAFLDASLKGDTSAASFLKRSDSSSPVSIRYRPTP